MNLLNGGVLVPLRKPNLKAITVIQLPQSLFSNDEVAQLETSSGLRVPSPIEASDNPLIGNQSSLLFAHHLNLRVSSVMKYCIHQANCSSTALERRSAVLRRVSLRTSDSVFSSNSRGRQCVQCWGVSLRPGEFGSNIWVQSPACRDSHRKPYRGRRTRTFMLIVTLFALVIQGGVGFAQQNKQKEATIVSGMSIEINARAEAALDCRITTHSCL